MKTRFFLVFLLLLALNLVLFARTAELDIRMSDNSSIIVVVDNYEFNENRNSYHITGLSQGYHSLEVYRIMYNSFNPHAPATTQLFYSGRIYLQGGFLTYAEVSRSGHLRILRKVALNAGYHGHGNHGNHYGHGSHGHSGGGYGYGGYSHSYGMDPAAFAELRGTIARASFDSNKLDIAMFAVSRNRMTSAQVADITRMFSFESNRLEFAKYAYSFVTDPGSYFMVANAFTFSSSKRELFDFIGYGSGY